MPQRACETLFRDVVQGLHPPTRPMPSTGGSKPSFPRLGPSALPNHHHHPTTRALGTEGAKGRPAAKGQRGAQGDQRLPTEKIHREHHKATRPETTTAGGRKGTGHNARDGARHKDKNRGKEKVPAACPCGQRNGYRPTPARLSTQISATTKRGCRPWAGSPWGPRTRGADLLLPPPPRNRNRAGPKAGPAPPPPPACPHTLNAGRHMVIEVPQGADAEEQECRDLGPAWQPSRWSSSPTQVNR